MSTAQPSSGTPPDASDRARDAGVFAHTLVAAVRTRQMYSTTHPASQASDERFRAAAARLLTHGRLVLGITPDTLLLDGDPMPHQARVQEAAALLNDHDVVCLQVMARPSPVELGDFLALLCLDANVVRQRGGPLHVLEEPRRRWIRIDQIDYDSLLASPDSSRAPRPDEDEQSVATLTARDHVWRDLVRLVGTGYGTLDDTADRRLRRIARSSEAIRQLTSDAVLRQAATGGGVNEAAQAATVLLTFQRLVGTPGAQAAEGPAPAGDPAVIDNIAEAAAGMDPALLMRAFGDAAESGLGTELITAIGARLSDEQVAGLLANSLAAEGKASGRMAAAFNTLTPEEPRRDRVLRMARNRPAALGRALQPAAAAVWETLEHLMAGPADAAYVSRYYGQSIEQADARSRHLRLDAPRQIVEWTQSVSAESVRTLSATLLLDLFALESDPGALSETAQDLATLADDLLLVSDTVEVERIVYCLHDAAGASTSRAAAARQGLESIARLPVLADVSAAVGDMDDRQFEAFRHFCPNLGIPVLDTLLRAEANAASEAARQRLDEVMAGFGNRALDRLTEATGGPDDGLAQAAIRTLGRMGGGRAVAVLQALVQGGGTERARAAAHTLVGMNDQAALRALAGLLRHGPAASRFTAIDALAASKQASSGALLSAALLDADLLGSDHDVALRLLAALRIAGGPEAVPALSRALTARRWFAVRRARRLASLAASVLAAQRSPAAREALAAAERKAGFIARRAIRAAQQAGC